MVEEGEEEDLARDTCGRSGKGGFRTRGTRIQIP